MFKQKKMNVQEYDLTRARLLNSAIIGILDRYREEPVKMKRPLSECAVVMTAEDLIRIWDLSVKLKQEIKQ